MTNSSIKYSISLKPVSVTVEQVAKEGVVDFSRNAFEVEAEKMEQETNQRIENFINEIKGEEDVSVIVKKSAELAFMWVKDDDETRAEKIEKVLSLFEKQGSHNLLMFVAKGLIFWEDSLELIKDSFASRIINEENKDRISELQSEMSDFESSFKEEDDFDLLNKSQMERISAIQDELESFQDQANARMSIAIKDNYIFGKQLH